MIESPLVAVPPFWSSAIVVIAIARLVCGGRLVVLRLARAGGRDEDAGSAPPLPPAARAKPPPPTAPPPPPAAAAQPAAPKAPPPPADVQASVAKMSEAVLMARLRELAASDPEAAIQLARAGNQRFPDSADAPERASILVHALAERAWPARRGARPNTRSTTTPTAMGPRDRGLQRAHRHRNLRVNDAGVLRLTELSIHLTSG